MIEIVQWTARQPCERLDAILARNASPSAEVEETVRRVIERVRREGDEALIALAREIDGVEMAISDLRVTRERLEELAQGLEPGLLAALEVAADNIRAFHEEQRDLARSPAPAGDGRVALRVLPVGSAGLYVPGGKVASPSTVLMDALPAAVAGVERLVAVTPAQALLRTPALAAAFQIGGIDEVYAVGGAQAIAALAYGTETIKRVHKVVGPGNAYVMAAKRQVVGAVGIDSLAGPTEVVVVADRTADPAWVAADLLAQAEHDQDAAAIAIVCDDDQARQIQAEVERQAQGLPREDLARESLRRFGTVFRCLSLESACRLVNVLAPEHVELMVDDPEALVPLIHHTGAIFLGHHSPEVVGDYIAGVNHVLPTGGAARFGSPLGVWDFVKRTNLVRWTASELASCGSNLVRLAEAEGLQAHASSVRIRQRDPIRLERGTLEE